MAAPPDLLSRSGRRQRRLRARGAHRRREGGDVIGAVVASPVYEEGRRAGDAAEVGAVDIIRDPGGAGVLAKVIGEAIDVERELLGVAD
jgi:hypothetical protein